MALKEKLSSLLAQCRRVWQLLRKPTTEEFKAASKISAIGLGIIGLIGFVITIVMNFVYPK